MKNPINQYLHTIKQLLPNTGHAKRKYIKDIKANISDFAAENPELTVETLYKEFGDPKDLLTDYINNCDTDTIVKTVTLTHYRKILIEAIIICILMICFVVSGIAIAESKAFHQFKNKIHESDTTIHFEEPESSVEIYY